MEYFSLLARKNNASRKKLEIKPEAPQANRNPPVLKAHDISVVEMDENSNTENLIKEKSEITALEHLSYINAWARMELLHANSNLINYHILKKNVNLKKQGNSDLGENSLDMTLTFRSEFNLNTASSKNSGADKRGFVHKAGEAKAPLNKHSFSNILEENPATLIKQ